MPTIALSIGLTEPIGEWETLVRTVRAWTNRDDWTDEQITEFIAICEARLNRLLRHPEMEFIADAVLNTGNNNLPEDFLAMRSIWSNGCELKAMTPTALISTYGTSTGQSVAYTLLGGYPRKIRLGPQPESDTAITMVYYGRLVGVSENNSDNWLLNEHPDIYLYGTLLAAEAYLASDERLPMWKSAYDEALGELIRAGHNDRYGSGLVIASPVKQIRGARA